jgi:hypothetical protein
MLWLMLTVALFLGVCNLYTQKIWLEDAVDDLRSSQKIYIWQSDAAIARIMEQEHQDQEVLMLDLQMGGSY